MEVWEIFCLSARAPIRGTRSGLRRLAHEPRSWSIATQTAAKSSTSSQKETGPTAKPQILAKHPGPPIRPRFLRNLPTFSAFGT